MIFSLSKKIEYSVPFVLEDTHIFGFFHSENAVFVPEDFWFPSILSSLKMKKNVLILEAPLEASPSIDHAKRWIVGENWAWLTPRSASVLLEAPFEIRTSYLLFKRLLVSSK